MQVLKIFLVLLFFFCVTLLGFYLIPVNRTFQASIGLDMSDVTVFRSLTDTTEWKSWYGDPSPLRIDTASPYKLVRYVTGPEDLTSKEGEVKIKQVYVGESVVQWKEKVVIRKDIMEKLRLLFAPSGYSNKFLGRVSKFKGKLDHPTDKISGLRLEISEIPSYDIAVRTDTMKIAEVGGNIETLYRSLISNFKDAQLKYPGLIQTRMEMINDSMVRLRVGAVLKDSLLKVKSPILKIEAPSYKALVAHVNGNLDQVNDDVKIMNDWLRKHAGRFAADFWLEHQYSYDENNQLTNSFNIVQPIYFLK
ncbi:MAG: hypothetical protein C5B52_13390 [Bacteroidetes bacterium]|nr:MAG: hypothetical protein C5B52_13390 [Bacteroidota bacterium]